MQHRWTLLPPPHCPHAHNTSHCIGSAVHPSRSARCRGRPASAAACLPGGSWVNCSPRLSLPARRTCDTSSRKLNAGTSSVGFMVTCSCRAEWMRGGALIGGDGHGVQALLPSRIQQAAHGMSHVASSPPLAWRWCRHWHPWTAAGTSLWGHSARNSTGTGAAPGQRSAAGQGQRQGAPRVRELPGRLACRRDGLT